MTDRETVKRIALEAGFKLREQQGTGRIDLNEYVYDFANRLVAEMAKGAEPVALPSDEQMQAIEDSARTSFRRHQSSIRGQMITAADSYDSHLIWATWEMANKLYPCPQPAIPPGWQPIETAPKDGTLIILLFAHEDEVLGQRVHRVRPASWCGDWSIPYYQTNPPISWQPMPAAPEPSA